MEFGAAFVVAHPYSIGGCSFVPRHTLYWVVGVVAAPLHTLCRVVRVAAVVELSFYELAWVFVDWVICWMDSLPHDQC